MEITVHSQSDDYPAAPAVITVKSAASWPATIAATLMAIAASLTLLALGSGFGLTSPSSSADGHEMLGTTFVVSTVIWLLMTQWVSAGLGGYLAGRLRSRWHGSHTRRIFFRDAAHGLVTWLAATIVVAILVGPTVGSMVAGAAQRTSTPVSESAAAPLLLADSAGAGAAVSDPTIGSYQIMGNTLATGSVPILARTDLFAAPVTTGAAESRAPLQMPGWLVKGASTEVAMYAAISLLIGAYIASLAAGLGGVFRDEFP
jgi:hypothetical protein